MRNVDGAEPPAGEDHERSMMEGISRGSRQAFATLFDRTSAIIDAELTARLRDPGQRAAILAAAYLEVWWLAGCHSGPEPDVTQWIRRILDRRVAEEHRAMAHRVQAESRPGHAELELAHLLGRPLGLVWPV